MELSVFLWNIINHKNPHFTEKGVNFPLYAQVQVTKIPFSFSSSRSRTQKKEVNIHISKKLSIKHPALSTMLNA